MPRGFITNDEPSGDFGIAHFNGLNSEGYARFTFDNHQVPTRYVVLHEIGHAVSAEIARRRDMNNWPSGLYDEYWAARNFPGRAWEAQLRAIELEKQCLNCGYRYWPEESFADTFGAVNSWGQGALITHFYDTYLDEGAMRAFYKNLQPTLGGDDLAADPVIVAKLDALISAINANTDKVGALAHSVMVWMDREQRGADVVSGGPDPQATKP
jgi:hypothetical protein